MVSLWSSTFTLILDYVFKRVGLSFTKLGQWSKKWQVDSISKPQLHAGQSKLKELCLNTFPKKMSRLKELNIDEPKLLKIEKKGIFKKTINQAENT